MEDNEDLIKIQLTQGMVAIIDKEDYGKVCSYKWFAVRSRGNYYAAAHGVNRETIKMHRVIMGVVNSKIICDHKDHNGLNNRKENIRICSNSENVKNTTSRKNTTSKYLGVCYKPTRKRKLKSGHYSISEYTKKWVAQIQCNGKKFFIGRFLEEKQAALAYNKAATEKFNDFANLNIIQ